VNTIEKFTAGVVAIGLVTAVGLHASGLAQATTSGGNAASKVLGTAEQG
jgi:hypothetical protein